MKKPRRAVVAILVAPLLGACMGLQARPLPEPPGRQPDGIRGVILAGSGGEEDEWVEVDGVEEVRWTDSTLLIVGRYPGSVSVETREFPFSSLSGILVRSIDVNRTSAIIGVAALGLTAAAALIFNGEGGAGPRR